jgi:hypothetical protein
MRKTGACFHGGNNGVPSPFDAVKLPAGWSLLGEVMGCPAEPGVWDPATVARMLWESPTHHRIVFASKKVLAIGCNWSMAKNKQDMEIIVCLTLRQDGKTPAAPSPLVIRAGYGVRFSSDGQVLSTVKLGPGDYNAILKGPLFVGFVSNLPERDALYRWITENVKGVVLPPAPGS